MACSLDSASLDARLASIAALNASALTGASRGDLTLVLEYRRDALEALLAMIRSERSCCGFLRFSLDEQGERLVLTITAPEAARAAAESLFQQFATKGPAAGRRA